MLQIFLYRNTQKVDVVDENLMLLYRLHASWFDGISTSLLSNDNVSWSTQNIIFRQSLSDIGVLVEDRHSIVMKFNENGSQLTVDEKEFFDILLTAHEQYHKAVDSLKDRDNYGTEEPYKPASLRVSPNSWFSP